MSDETDEVVPALPKRGGPGRPKGVKNGQGTGPNSNAAKGRSHHKAKEKKAPPAAKVPPISNEDFDNAPPPKPPTAEEMRNAVGAVMGLMMVAAQAGAGEMVAILEKHRGELATVIIKIQRAYPLATMQLSPRKDALVSAGAIMAMILFEWMQAKGWIPNDENLRAIFLGEELRHAPGQSPPAPGPSVSSVVDAAKDVTPKAA